ncbi:MAG: iron-sulfur cluster assembly protein [Amaricoccus sp.]|uniref:iron-sulfur cluster assembly protein n=1 Tax=Amaricoccus sp. TaxID=1872485 RepID=UPI0039E4857E
MREMLEANTLRSDVWRALARVADPELDEPVTDMGFIEDVEFAGPPDDAIVTVVFRLPTYWCSPNFAFLMADGISREVAGVAGVTRVLVRLEDHMHAEEVMAAVNGGRRFEEVFAALCDGADLSELRATFDAKAFQRRQESVLARLRALGWSDRSIAAMTLRQLDAVDFDGGEASAQRPRYREALVRRGLARWPGDLAFRTWEGEALTPEGLKDYVLRLRQVRLNMEFSGALCRGLQGSRYKELGTVDGEPTLVDFVLGRIPARTGGGASGCL